MGRRATPPPRLSRARGARLASSVVAVALAVLGRARAEAGASPVHVVVVASAGSEESKALARHYEAKRRLPRGRVCVADVPADAEELTLEQARDLERALRRHLRREGLVDVRYLVLARGVPVRVAVPGGRMSTAAFLMAMDTPLAGRLQPRAPDAAMASPLARGPGEAPDLDAPVAVDGEDRPRLRLATHLAAYTLEDAKALVDRGASCDHAFPKGAVAFQDARRPADFRDGQFDAAAEAVRALGREARRYAVGKPPAGEELVVWLSGGAYSALSPQEIAANRYPPGAVADMLESFGAVPANFVEGGPESQRSVAHFVRAGITGVHGAVAEPYAHVFPHALVAAKYLRGYDLAEAFHGTIPYLAWQNLVIGDPLAKPFAPRLEVEATLEPGATPSAARVVARATTAREGARVESLSLWADGRRLATSPGDSAEWPIDLSAFPDGPVDVRVVAEEGLPARGCGEAILVATASGPPDRLLGVVPDEDAPWDVSEPVRLRFGSAAGARAARPALEALDASGAASPAAATTRVEGSEALVALPAAPPPGTSFRLRFRAQGGERVAALRAPAPLALKAHPAESAAGEEVVFRAVSGGEPHTGPLFLACDDPRAQGTVPAEVSPDAEGRFRVAFARAGRRVLQATDLATGREASGAVVVAAGAPARIALRCPTPVSAGRPVDVTVVAFDAFENRVPLADARVVLRGPGDAESEPLALRADGTASATFPAPAKGRVKARVEGGAGDGLAGATEEEVSVLRPAISAWTVSGPWPSLAPKDPKAPLATVLDPKAFDARRKVAPGKVEDAGGKARAVWTVSLQDVVDLGAALPETSGDAVHVALLSATLRAAEPVEGAVLRVGLEGDVAVFWDGRRVEGESAGKGVSDPLAFPVDVGRGTHALLLAVARKGRLGRVRASLESASKDAAPSVAEVAPGRGEPPDLRSVRVESGPRGKTPAATVRATFSAVLDPRAAVDPARWRVAVDGKAVDLRSLALRIDPTAKKVVLERVPAAAGAKVEVVSLSARGADGAERTTPVSRAADAR